ncbi:hypothetical protein GCM10009504_06090 [Pseudomonas laurentiana]|uniref:hypothetical protein n=1 Tax=Pseudomonas laurentiana TaxID=2364649 RepID=UPI0019BBE202|nr:hypothetical protein [Pseudomonas laurentiana]GGU52075.1 hypothetical protein GCM10009504_06090 [Pseudomonas laurentiana]
MGNHHNLLRLLLMGCALSTAVCLPVQAAGSGVIVIQRDVQPRPAVRPTGTPDPHPMTVNANESKRVVGQTNNNELSDGDFARVASGSSLVTRLLAPDNSGTVRGIGAAQQVRLPGMGGGSGAGSGGGNSISNQVNQNVQRGMAPLQILTGGR